MSITVLDSNTHKGIYTVCWFDSLLCTTCKYAVSSSVSLPTAMRVSAAEPYLQRSHSECLCQGLTQRYRDHYLDFHS